MNSGNYDSLVARVVQALAAGDSEFRSMYEL
jgi:hypothetical protein